MAGLALRKRFTCFGRLPLEIRLMIWERALPGPRLVNIRQRPTRKTLLDYMEEKDYDLPSQNDHDETDGSEEGIRAWNNLSLELSVAQDLPVPFYEARLFGLSSDSPTPPMTFVCWESYRVVSRYYTKAFACMGSSPGTYFDFDVDTLYIHDARFAFHINYIRNLENILDGLTGVFKITDVENAARVQKLAIAITGCPRDRELKDLIDGLLEVFGGVKEISLIVGDHNNGHTLMNTHHLDDIEFECIIDPISFDAAIRQYHQCRNSTLRRKVQQVRIPIHYKAKQVAHVVEAWEAKRESSGSKERRRLPKIEAKILVTPRAVRDLGRAVALYNTALRDHEQKMRMDREAAGFCTDDALSDDDF
ncbi:uncharacterized protein RAG0_12673 [Rhynchosporium agropyri]|uniref:2EXR domain-containing protein n=1 Tax=Rhynchosporium agropyri TaxID=914238 RepID=A0A1E1L9E4_9HELO|nr:uncharacterized protein RAG0_12673 [Rhynchosporium agropyri]